jgi:hypothetical protein
MAINTYATLKTSIASWIARSDLSSVIPDFVTLAEADIRSDVRVRAMEAFTTGTLTGETLAHPTRFLEARRFVLGNLVYRYETPEVYQQLIASDSTAGKFTSIGQSFYILNGASGDAYSLIYYAGFAAFSADADTNWLLDNHPEVYLYGSLKYAAVYLKNDADTNRYASLYQDAVGRMLSKDRAGVVSGSALTMRSSSVE